MIDEPEEATLSLSLESFKLNQAAWLCLKSKPFDRKNFLLDHRATTGHLPRP